MSLHVILGPMKSGKSLELLARTTPFLYTPKKIIFVQPSRNVRDAKLQSRLGVSIDAVKSARLAAVESAADVIVVDEVHMFEDRSDYKTVKKWLVMGKDVYASGLDTDYRGRLMPMVARLLELQPESVVRKTAVCDVCGEFNARFTAIRKDGKRIRNGLPRVVPEDGNYEYQANCRSCFFTDVR